MQAREYEEMSVDECDGCGGLFLSHAMLDRLVAARDTPSGLHLALPKRAVAREASVRYIRCPVCRKTMNRQAFGRVSGVIVDVCKADGMWFDAGELAEVIRFVEQGGLAVARAREMEDLAERERKSRSEMAIAESSAFFASHTGSTVRGWGSSSSSSNVFADLLQAIVKAWR